MTEWRMLPLGEIFEVRLGKMLSAGSGYGRQYKYLANRNVQWGRIVIDDLGTMNFSAIECKRYRLRPGDLLVCEGGEVGRAAIWSGELSECYFQNAIYRLRASSLIDVHFMRYYLEYASVVGLLRALTGQTSIGHLPQAKLVRWLVPVPPIEEQRRIAEILDMIDRSIGIIEHVIAKRNKVRSGLVTDLLAEFSIKKHYNKCKCNIMLLNNQVKPDQVDPDQVDPLNQIDDVSENADDADCDNYVNLAEIADLNPQSLRADTPADYIFKYIDLSAVSRGLIDEESLEKVRFADAPSRARRLVQDGDMLFGTVRPSLRSHAKVKGDGYVASTGFCVIRPRRSLADGGFISHFVLSDETARQASTREVGSNYPAVTERDVAAFRLPRIELREQRRIAEILDTAADAVRADEAQLDKLRKTRAGLVADLLSGRMRTVPV